jgi:hypothetical protein
MYYHTAIWNSRHDVPDANHVPALSAITRLYVLMEKKAHRDTDTIKSLNRIAQHHAVLYCIIVLQNGPFHLYPFYFDNPIAWKKAVHEKVHNYY